MKVLLCSYCTSWYTIATELPQCRVNWIFQFYFSSKVETFITDLNGFFYPIKGDFFFPGILCISYFTEIQNFQRLIFNQGSVTEQKNMVVHLILNRPNWEFKGDILVKKTVFIKMIRWVRIKNSNLVTLSKWPSRSG